MVDTQKEQEREKLHRAIWSITDELHGAVDGWDFKNYVLGTVFFRYISENLYNCINDPHFAPAGVLTPKSKAEQKIRKIEGANRPVDDCSAPLTAKTEIRI